MGGIAGKTVVPLRHEGDGLAEAPRDFLAGILEDRMPVGHFERLGVFDIDFLLPRSPLSLRVFDWYAGSLQAVADRPHHTLFLGRLQDMIVLNVVAGGLEV